MKNLTIEEINEFVNNTNLVILNEDCKIVEYESGYKLDIIYDEKQPLTIFCNNVVQNLKGDLIYNPSSRNLNFDDVKIGLNTDEYFVIDLVQNLLIIKINKLSSDLTNPIREFTEYPVFKYNVTSEYNGLIKGEIYVKFDEAQLEDFRLAIIRDIDYDKVHTMTKYAVELFKEHIEKLEMLIKQDGAYILYNSRIYKVVSIGNGNIVLDCIEKEKYSSSGAIQLSLTELISNGYSIINKHEYTISEGVLYYDGEIIPYKFNDIIRKNFNVSKFRYLNSLCSLLIDYIEMSEMPDAIINDLYNNYKKVIDEIYSYKKHNVEHMLQNGLNYVYRGELINFNKNIINHSINHFDHLLEKRGDFKEYEIKKNN